MTGGVNRLPPLGLMLFSVGDAGGGAGGDVVVGVVVVVVVEVSGAFVLPWRKMRSNRPSRRSLHLRQQPQDDEPSEMTPCWFLSICAATSLFLTSGRGLVDGCSPQDHATVNFVRAIDSKIDADSYSWRFRPRAANARAFQPDRRHPKMPSALELPSWIFPQRWQLNTTHRRTALGQSTHTRATGSEMNTLRKVRKCCHRLHHPNGSVRRSGVRRQEGRRRRRRWRRRWRHQRRADLVPGLRRPAALLHASRAGRCSGTSTPRC